MYHRVAIATDRNQIANGIQLVFTGLRSHRDRYAMMNENETGSETSGGNTKIEIADAAFTSECIDAGTSGPRVPFVSINGARG
jgi:hypothetical protein